MQRRRRLLVDVEIQGAILKRVAIYWAFCVLFIMTPIVVINVLSQFGSGTSILTILSNVFREYWLSFAFALLLLPMALMDALKLSHGFVGPMIRLRKELAKQATRTDIEFPKFRDSDFWNSLAIDVSRFTDDLEEAGATTGSKHASA